MPLDGDQTQVIWENMELSENIEGEDKEGSSQKGELGFVFLLYCEMELGWKCGVGPLTCKAWLEKRQQHDKMDLYVSPVIKLYQAFQNLRILTNKYLNQNKMLNAWL